MGIIWRTPIDLVVASTTLNLGSNNGAIHYHEKLINHFKSRLIEAVPGIDVHMAW